MAKQRVFWVAVDQDGEEVQVFRKKPHLEGIHHWWYDYDEFVNDWWGPKTERHSVLELCSYDWFRFTGIRIKAGEAKKVSVVEV